MSSFEFLVCLVLIFISSFMAASEVALFSLSRFQLRTLKENFRAIHRKIKRLLSDPGGLLMTILIVNEILNVAISSLITNAAARRFASFSAQVKFLPPWAAQTLLGVALAAPVILLLCEVTPKVIAVRINVLVATIATGPLALIYKAFKPIRFILRGVITRVTNLFSKPVVEIPHAEDEMQVLKESDFLLMIEEGHKEGAIQQSEMDLIRNVFELDDTTVESVCTPLSQVQSLAETTTLRDALNLLRAQRFSRIPITGDSSKDVVGVLYAKDVLLTKHKPEMMETPVSEIMKKPFFISPKMRLNALFRKFKQQKIHMAVVQSSYGEASGIVTMSDILDALFEELSLEETEAS